MGILDIFLSPKENYSGKLMRSEYMDRISPEVQASLRLQEYIGPKVERSDILPSVVSAIGIGRLQIPEDFKIATLAGELTRQSNPFVIGSGPNPYAYEAHGFEPTTREADFIGSSKSPIEVVDVIGGIGATYLNSYETIYGPDRLARMLSILRGGKTAKLPGLQRDEDEEILWDIDRLLSSVRRFAATGRTEDAEKYAVTSRRMVDAEGELKYTPQLDGTVKRIISVPTDKRVNEFERERLDVILPKLSFSKSRGYQYLARAHRLFGDAAVRISIGSFI